MNRIKSEVNTLHSGGLLSATTMNGKNSQNDPSLYLKNSKKQKKKEESRPYKKIKITDLTKVKEG
jgi:hypothetical protein